jgi:hypothetical protein
VPPPQASEVLYTTLQRYQLMLLVAGRRLWSRMAPADLDGSWARIAPQMTAFTSGAQLAAAQAAVAYVPAVLEETGQPDRPEAAVRPRAFSGVTSDGRSIPGLLEGSVVATKRAIERGTSPADALVGGQKWLETALQGAVSDAARDATAAQIVVRPEMGWVRMVNPPCCSRCAVLAGQFYQWNTGFQRHPRCDCVHIPSQENRGGDFVTDPKLLVDRGLITDLTPGQKSRLADGANLPKVLNESRDRWRERMAADRRAQRELSKRQQWAGAEPGPARTVNDFMAHLTSRADAINAMKSAGIAE